MDWLVRRKSMKSTAVLGIVFVMSGAAWAQTMQQAETGRGVYQARCAGCHAADLGGNEGPALAGSNFVAAWGSRVVRELVNIIQTTMPPGNAGGLGEETAVNLAAFILAANGATPGNQPLTAAAAFPIRSVTTGRPAIAVQA